MDIHQRAAFHAAMEIHRKLCKQQGQGVDPLLPEFLWEQCGRLVRQQAEAKRRGLTAAARCVGAELLGELAECRRRLDELCAALEQAAAPPTVASPSDIYRDILALEEEFVGAMIDHEAATITVEEYEGASVSGNRPALWPDENPAEPAGRRRLVDAPHVRPE